MDTSPPSSDHFTTPDEARVLTRRLWAPGRPLPTFARLWDGDDLDRQLDRTTRLWPRRPPLLKDQPFACDCLLLYQTAQSRGDFRAVCYFCHTYTPDLSSGRGNDPAAEPEGYLVRLEWWRLTGFWSALVELGALEGYAFPGIEGPLLWDRAAALDEPYPDPREEAFDQILSVGQHRSMVAVMRWFLDSLGFPEWRQELDEAVGADVYWLERRRRARAWEPVGAEPTYEEASRLFASVCYMEAAARWGEYAQTNGDPCPWPVTQPSPRIYDILRGVVDALFGVVVALPVEEDPEPVNAPGPLDVPAFIPNMDMGPLYEANFTAVVDGQDMMVLDPGAWARFARGLIGTRLLVTRIHWDYPPSQDTLRPTTLRGLDGAFYGVLPTNAAEAKAAGPSVLWRLDLRDRDTAYASARPNGSLFEPEDPHYLDTGSAAPRLYLRSTTTGPARGEECAALQRALLELLGPQNALNPALLRAFGRRNTQAGRPAALGWPELALPPIRPAP